MNLSPKELTLYERKLKDPKWRVISALVKSRDGHRCQECGTFAAEFVKLHGHHKKYTKYEPWMEPQENLVTLCEHCHDLAHATPIQGINEVSMLARMLVKKADYRVDTEVRKQERLSLERQVEWARNTVYGK